MSVAEPDPHDPDTVALDPNRPRLPGDPTPRQVLERALRVDQAGEYGAVRIYAGQMAVLGRRASTAAIRRMAAQEHEHLAECDALLNARKVRPTALAPVWHVAGFALGAATALMGEKAAMACTAAVEEVIVEHYQAQVTALADEEPEIAARLRAFAADEEHHRAEALASGAERTPGYGLLSAAIRTGCRLAIRISERV